MRVPIASGQKQVKQHHVIRASIVALVLTMTLTSMIGCGIVSRTFLKGCIGKKCSSYKSCERTCIEIAPDGGCAKYAEETADKCKEEVSR